MANLDSGDVILAFRLARLEWEMAGVPTLLVFKEFGVDVGAAAWSFALSQPTVTKTSAR